MKEKRRKWETVGFIIGVAIVILLYVILKIPCPIRYVTGISCPGCGMTRAFVSAIKLDLAAAFGYNPAWVAVIAGGIALTFLRIFKKERAFEIILYVTLGAIILTYLVRLAFFRDSVVAIELDKGLIGRGIAYVVNAMQNTFLQ